MGRATGTGAVILFLSTLVDCIPIKGSNYNGLTVPEQADHDPSQYNIWSLGILVSVSFSIMSISILVFCAGTGIRCFRNFKIFERRKRDYCQPSINLEQKGNFNNSLSPENFKDFELHPVTFEPLPILPKINPNAEKNYQQEIASIIISASTSPPSNDNLRKVSVESESELYFSVSPPPPQISVSQFSPFSSAVSYPNQSNDILNNNNNIHIDHQEKIIQTPKPNNHLEVGVQINLIEPTPSPSVKINLIKATPNPSPSATSYNYDGNCNFQQDISSNTEKPQPRLLKFKFDSSSEDNVRKRRTSTPIKTPSPTIVLPAELEDVFEPKDLFGNTYSVSPIKSNSSFEDNNTLNSIMDVSQTYEQHENLCQFQSFTGESKTNPINTNSIEELLNEDILDFEVEGDLKNRSFQLPPPVKRDLFKKEEDKDSAWNIVDPSTSSNESM